MGAGEGGWVGRAQTGAPQRYRGPAAARAPTWPAGNQPEMGTPVPPGWVGCVRANRRSRVVGWILDLGSWILDGIAPYVPCDMMLDYYGIMMLLSRIAANIHAATGSCTKNRSFRCDASAWPPPGLHLGSFFPSAGPSEQQGSHCLARTHTRTRSPATVPCTAAVPYSLLARRSTCP